MPEIFDESQAQELGSRNPTIGPSTGFLQNVQSSFRAMSLANTTVAEQLALEEEYDRELDRIARETGKTFDNPFSLMELPEQEPNLFGQAPQAEPRLDTFEGQARQLTERLQEQGIEIRPFDKIREDALATMREAERENIDIARRATASGTLGQFTGGVAGVLRDPPILASMAVGAPVSAGILRTMLIESGIGAGVEAGVQPGIQAQRAEAGLPSGFEEGVRNVVLAAGGAAAFSGLVKSAARGVQIARDRTPTPRNQEELDAARFEERRQGMENENPFETAAGQAEHTRRLSQVLRDLSDETPILRVTDEPDSPLAIRSRPMNLAERGVDDATELEQEVFRFGENLRQRAVERRPQEPVRREIETVRERLREIATEKLSRGDRQRLVAERTRLIRRRQEIADEPLRSATRRVSEEEPDMRRLKARQRRQEVRRRQNRRIQEIDDEINVIETRLAVDRPRREAEGELSRIEQELDELSPRAVGQRTLERIDERNIPVDVDGLRGALDRPVPDSLQDPLRTAVRRSLHERTMSVATARAASAAEDADASVTRTVDNQDTITEQAEAAVNDLDPEREVRIGEGADQRTVTVRELLQENQREQKLLDEFTRCARG